MTARKLISVVTPCYNEEGNVGELYRQTRDILEGLGRYDYEHIFIDNASQDKTPEILKDLARKDSRVKVILNTRNFGPIRSGYHALIQARGDAAILIVADLQVPTSVIPELIRKWEEGKLLVKAIRARSCENAAMNLVRGFYYALADKLSDVKLDNHFTGVGLYDRRVVEELRGVADPYPYLRGIVAELGFESDSVEYVQASRKSGKSSYRFYDLYDTAVLGITSHSKVPLRIATFSGFIMSIISFTVGLGYLVAKFVFWSSFPLGMAPLIIAVFFLFSVLLFFVGILGEYIGLIHTRVLNRARVIEKERINFSPEKKNG
jgi:glycosyltransferase involved in cell wall biosynthesis